MKFNKIISVLFFLTVSVFTGTNAVAQTDDSRELKPGETLEREMTGAQTHGYRFSLATNECFQVRVEQKGVDVALKLLDANKNTLAKMDSPNALEGYETLTFAAEKAEDFILEVSGFDANAAKGIYIIKRELARTATADDRRRFEIEKIFVEGMTARDTAGQGEIALQKLETAQKGWQEIKDEYLEKLTAQQIEQIKKALNQPRSQPLEIGVNIEGQVSAGQLVQFSIELKKGAALQVEVEEIGIDIIVGLYKADKDQFLKRYSVSSSGDSRERLTFIVEETGNYSVIVGGQNTDQPGKFLLKAQLNETANQADKELIDAEMLLNEPRVGSVQNAEIQTKEIIKSWELSAAIWKKIGNVYWEGYTDYLLGNAYLKLKDTAKALEKYNRALTLFEGIKDEKQQLFVLLNTTAIYQEQKDKNKSVESLGKLASIWHSLNYPTQEALIYTKLALLLNPQPLAFDEAAIKDYEQSIKYQQKALEIYQRLNDRLQIIMTAGSLASQYNQLGKFAEVQKYVGINWATEIEIPKGANEQQGKQFRGFMESSKAMSKNTLAMAYFNQRDWVNAEENFNELLAFTEKNDDKDIKKIRFSAKMLSAQIHIYKYEWDQAIEKHERLSAEAKLAGDNDEIAKILNSLGGVYVYTNQYNQAIKIYEQSLEAVRAVKEKDIFSLILESSIINSMGVAYSDLGQMQDALKFHEKALLIIKDVNDPIIFDARATTYNNIATTYKEQGDFRKSLENLNLALELFQKAPPFFRNLARNRSKEALFVNNIGSLYGDIAGDREALKYHNQSWELAKNTEDKSIKATILKSIAISWSQLGDNETAFRFLNEALTLNREIADEKEISLTLGSIATMYDRTDEKEKAIEYYDKAITIARKIKSKSIESMMLSNKGSLYSDLGENKIALEWFNQAMKIAEEIGDQGQKAIILNNVGTVYENLGDKPAALKNYQEATVIFNKIGIRRLEATTLANVGKVYLEMNDRRNALENLQSSLALSRAVEDKTQTAFTLNSIGRVYSNVAEKENALKNFSEALLFTNIVEHKVQESTIFWRLMNLYRKTGNRRMAIFLGKLSVNGQQTLRRKISGLDNETQKSFLKRAVERYKELAQLLIEEDNKEQAVQVLNIFKDQQSFDLKAEQNDPIKQVTFSERESELASAYKQISEKVWKTNNELEESNRKIGNRPPTADEATQIRKFEADLKKSADDYYAFFKQSENEFSKPADEKDKVGGIKDVEQMQTTLELLNTKTGQKAVAVYQLVGDENFSALLITPTAVEKISAPVKGAELNEKAKQLWALMQSHEYDTTVLSKQIYEIVFKPLTEKLPPDTTMIMWSMDGNLRYVPMAALFDGEKMLVESYNHAVFTRAEKEALTRDVSAVWTGTGFGGTRLAIVEILGEKLDPFRSLPFVKRELTGISKTAEGGVLDKTLLNADFTEAKFTAEVQQKRPLIHIASHFYFRPGDEARSFLLMGDGKPYTLEKMKRETNLFQDVELLTLSACNTAAQQADATGREIDGFAELAQRNGAGAVMATLWQVWDASTARLMSDFYAVRQGKAGTTKAAALRQAQLGLLNGTAKAKASSSASSQSNVKIVITPDGKPDGSKQLADVIYVAAKDAPLFKKNPDKPFAHPYYWSPFVLIGNWR